MFVSSTLCRLFQRFILVCLMCMMGLMPALQARAQMSLPPGNSSGGIVTKTCQPNVCFGSQAAKDQYAKDNKCKFLEDVCSKTKPEDDKNGAKPEDAGFWGGLWNDVKGALVYGYEFVKGLFEGLKEQVTDLFHMITNVGEVIDGLVQLGKAFFDDPKGTLKTMAELLGQEAVDTITKATQCGAYDLGKVVGSYVSPAFALKVATKLTKYSGKLAEVAKVLKHDFGCASFAAGTLVMTPAGLMPIEQISADQQVLSRNETTYADQAQAVTHTFGRIAPGYRELTTETGSFKVTGEHPLWVQGKGWTIADQVAVDDVIAGVDGDVLITGNEEVAKPLRVYNFSVAYTESYFVGGMWVHNAKCSIDMLTRSWSKLSKAEKGFRAEYEIFEELTAKGYEPVGKSFNPKGKSPQDAFKEWDGQKGIDGIYKDKNGNYVIVESKASGGFKNADPKDCVDKLCLLKGGERQLSDTWLLDKRIDEMVSDPVERNIIKEAVGKNQSSVKRIYARTDSNGTAYFEVKPNGKKDVKIGSEWKP